MSEPAKSSPLPALLLGFAPTMIVLMLLSIRGLGSLPREIPWLISAASVVCCFASSFLLFRRKTGLAITGGILFLLLNGALAFFFGCVAILTEV